MFWGIVSLTLLLWLVAYSKLENVLKVLITIGLFYCFSSKMNKLILIYVPNMVSYLISCLCCYCIMYSSMQDNMRETSIWYIYISNQFRLWGPTEILVMSYCYLAYCMLSMVSSHVNILLPCILHAIHGNCQKVVTKSHLSIIKDYAVWTYHRLQYYYGQWPIQN
jgi:hypothetical protein